MIRFEDVLYLLLWVCVCWDLSRCREDRRRVGEARAGPGHSGLELALTVIPGTSETRNSQKWGEKGLRGTE